MLNDATGFDKIYIACGYSDLRRGIDGFASMIQQKFKLDPFHPGILFLFCGRKTDRIKGILWEGDGFLLLYKRLETGKFQCPRNEEEVKAISSQQYKWLMEGLPIEQKKPLKTLLPYGFCSELTAGSKSYMWVYRTGKMYNATPIVLYEYQKTRNTSHPREFLKNYSGTVVTDGYQVYHTLEKEREGLEIAGCWSHSRRHFANVVKALGEEKAKGTLEYDALKQIAAIYKIEG